MSLRERLCGEWKTVRDGRNSGSVSMAQYVVDPLSKCKRSPEILVKTARKLWRVRKVARTEASAQSVQRTVV